MAQTGASVNATLKDCEIQYIQSLVTVILSKGWRATFSGKDISMTTAEADVQNAVRGGCDLFKRIIANLETRLRGERQRLAALGARLRKAEAQPKPDPAEIEQLKQSIATLQRDIDEDETSLADVRIDFEMFCSG